ASGGPARDGGGGAAQGHRGGRRGGVIPPRGVLGALPLPVGGEGWGGGATGPSTHFPLRDLNPSPHPSPYGRASQFEFHENFPFVTKPLCESGATAFLRGCL